MKDPSQPPPGRGARTRARLLDAMERLLARGGYPAATTTAVAEEADVSVGTVYTYFDDRDAMLTALFAARLDDLVATVDASLSTDALLDDGLAAILDGTLRAVVEGFAAHAAAFRAALVQLPSSPAIREVYWDRHDRSRAIVATFLARAQEAGKVRASDPDLLADTVLVVVQGLNHPLLTADPTGPGARRLTDEIARMLAGTLAPPPSM